MKHITQLLDVFKHFEAETQAEAIFIRIGDEYAFHIKQENYGRWGTIDCDDLNKTIQELCPNKQIQIISQPNFNGISVVPDINRLIHEKYLDSE